MNRTIDQVLAEDFSPDERAEIEAEADRMAQEIMTLREVRKAFRMTQETLARALSIEQESVSRIERRSDLLLSTLRNYVAAMGGSLKLIAEFPDHPPVQIETLSDLSDDEPADETPQAKTARKPRRPAPARSAS